MAVSTPDQKVTGLTWRMPSVRMKLEAAARASPPPARGLAADRYGKSMAKLSRLFTSRARLEHLWRKGLMVVPRYGVCGGVRIPLAIGHPDCPGELLVAVLTDDAAYVAEPSLRRRDRH